MARTARLASIVAALLCLLAPRVAWAWVDLTVSRDDLRVTLEPSGEAVVEHAILLLVAGGPLTELTVKGVDPDAVLEPGAKLVRDGKRSTRSEGGPAASEDPLPVSGKRVETAEGTSNLVLTLDEGRGVRRGRYWVHLRYRTNLSSRGLLRVAGSHALLEWSGPVWDFGLETTRATFVLPPSRMDPQVHEQEDSPNAGSFLPSVTRTTQSVELTLIRPYAARGERVTWPIRFDARVLEAGEAPRQAPPPVAVPVPKRTDSLSQTMKLVTWIGSLASFVAVFVLVLLGHREIAVRARERGQRSRPLLPLPSWLSALAAGGLFGGGVALVLMAYVTAGASAIATTSLFCLHGVARATSTLATHLRRPGAWLFVRKEEAFLRPLAVSREIFDLRSSRGKLLFALVVAASVGAGVAVGGRALEPALVLGLSFAPLSLLFTTGTVRYLRPDLAVDSVDLFREVVREVEVLARRRSCVVRVAPRLRKPHGGADADELRIVFLPEQPERGLRGVELAMETATTPLGSLLLPVVIVRYAEGSPAEQRVRAIARGARPTNGRKPEERAVILSPKVPTARVTAELCAAVLFALAATAESKTNTAATPADASGRPEPSAPEHDSPSRRRRAPTRSRGQTPEPGPANGEHTSADGVVTASRAG
jgi:hypothetical protein